jgi:hypothetical protein
MKPFTSLTIAVLALLALLQLTRMALGWTVVVDGFAVPVWASAVAAIIAGGLALMLYREK